MTGVSSEVVDLVRLALAFVKQHQAEKVAEQLVTARRLLLEEEIANRGEAQRRATKELAAIKRLVKAMRTEIAKFPPDLQLDAERRLWPVLDGFESDIIRLRARRARLECSLLGD